MRTLLTAFESIRKAISKKETPSEELLEIRSKFTAEVDAVFSGLPKPKDPISFTTNDLPLLFTASDVQRFALEHRLNKAQYSGRDKCKGTSSRTLARGPSGARLLRVFSQPKQTHVLIAIGYRRHKNKPQSCEPCWAQHPPLLPLGASNNLY